MLHEHQHNFRFCCCLFHCLVSCPTNFPNVRTCCCRFMWEYSTVLQFAKIILASQVLQVLGVPYANLCVYMAAAPLTAAFRLFYFGTYLPHLPPDNKTVMNWQKSHSSEDPSWLTFLKCYHFGLHWEHHR